MKKKTPEIFFNKLVYLDLSILETSKMVRYELWYDYFTQKFVEEIKLCNMDTDSFIVYIKMLRDLHRR